MLESQLRDIAAGLQNLGLLPSGSSAVGQVLTAASVAAMPAASAANAGSFCFVTGVSGGVMYYNPSGVSWVKCAPAIGEAGDYEVLYALGAPVTSGVAATTATLTFPNVIVPAGKLGNYGKLVIEFAAEVTTFAGTLSARTVQLGFGGAGNVMNDTANLHRRIGARRDVKCYGPSLQYIIERSNGEYTNLASINTAGQTLTKDQSVEQTVSGSAVWTSDQAIVATLFEYRVMVRTA